MTVTGIMLILIVLHHEDLATSIAPRGDGSQCSKEVYPIEVLGF